MAQNATMNLNKDWGFDFDGNMFFGANFGLADIKWELSVRKDYLFLHMSGLRTEGEGVGKFVDIDFSPREKVTRSMLEKLRAETPQVLNAKMRQATQRDEDDNEWLLGAPHWLELLVVGKDGKKQVLKLSGIKRKYDEATGKYDSPVIEDVETGDKPEDAE